MNEGLAGEAVTEKATTDSGRTTTSAATAEGTAAARTVDGTAAGDVPGGESPIASAVRDSRRRRRERRRRERREVRKLRLTFVYWAWYVLLLLATLAVSLLVVRILFTLHVLIAPGSVLLLAVFAITTILVGAVFSQVIVRGFTRPLLEMSDAAQKIQEGDYDISLTEPTFAEEIEDMAADFTDMAGKLAATEQMRNDFMANVSHEMKTPLAAISGYADLISSGGVTEEKQVEYAETIAENAKRLSALTDDILLLTRLESTGGELETETVDLAEQLREALLLFEGEWDGDDAGAGGSGGSAGEGGGGRVLALELDEVTCEGSADLLMSVWTNLVGNAVKFTSPGDTVEVRLHTVHADDGSAWAEVVVSDTGIGMTEEELERAFEKFYQADSSRATSGNGLGLALAQRIVTAHGGTIGAESEPGEGTEMTVRLPL